MRLNGGDHQKKKFFANNFVEVLILFSEKHRGIWTACTFGVGLGNSGEKGEHWGKKCLYYNE